MKLVSSLVRPERLGEIKNQLNGMNVRALTVVQAQDHAPQDHGTMVWRAHEYNLPSSLKMQVDVVVDDEDVIEWFRSSCAQPGPGTAVTDTSA